MTSFDISKMPKKFLIECRKCGPLEVDKTEDKEIYLHSLEKPEDIVCPQCGSEEAVFNGFIGEV